MIEDFKEARRVSTPIILINTPDYRQAIKDLVGADQLKAPAVCWNMCAGHVAYNEAGKKAVQCLGPSIDTVQAPSLVLQRSVGWTNDQGVYADLPKQSILLMTFPDDEVLGDPVVAQAIANVRDVFKTNQRILVILGRNLRLPALVAEDVPIINVPLPSEDTIKGIVKSVYGYAKVPPSDGDINKAATYLRGMTAFAVEDVVARKIRREGLDVSGLAKSQQVVIEASTNRALTFERQKVTFDDVGGQAAIKDFMTKLFAGPKAPKVVVRIDEIEKSIGANVSGPVQDNTGVSQGILRSLLTSMEDNQWLGLIALGGPGCLHGDTLIHDPVSGTTATVRQRWIAAQPFHVYARDKYGNVVIAPAESPEQYPVSQMVEVTFRSGRKMKVTPKHRFWDGVRYVCAEEISQHLRVFGAYRLPSSLESCLATQRQGARHSTQKAGDCQADCLENLHLYDAQPLLVAVGDQSSAPSHSDAHTHNLCSRQDGSAFSESNKPGDRLWAYQDDGLLSRNHYEDPFEPRLEDGCECRSHEEYSSRELCCFQTQQQQHQEIHRLHTRPMLQGCVHESSHDASQGAFGQRNQAICECTPTHLAQECHICHQSVSESCRRCSRQASVASSLKKPCDSPIGRRHTDNDTGFDFAVQVTYVESDNYYDFHVPIHNNYWANGFFHHNTGKTLCTSAVANTYGCLSLVGDLGAVKSSLVGSSEANMRRMMDVLLALAGDRLLVMATSNKLGVMPPELLRRFNLGIWYFARLTEQEKKSIWTVQAKKHGVSLEQEMPDDGDWVGSDIKNCVQRAWMLNCSLKEAAKFITISGKVSAKDVAQLDLLAENSGFLCANNYGVFKREGHQKKEGRQISL